MKALSKLKKLLKNHNLDAYVLPKNDEFFGEYAFPNRLKTISNFSGSAGFAVITCSINYLFVCVLSFFCSKKICSVYTSIHTRYICTYYISYCNVRLLHIVKKDPYCK